ncbi:MAG: site-2 protease family protein [Paenibacillaceae bacterium]
MFGSLFNHPEEIPFIFLALVIAFSIHEFAHAYAADKFGDPTPRSMGRVTLNPRVHLDVLGTLLIFLIGFGWAKPVLVNRANFKKPRLMGIIVSAVGPLSNLLIAFLGLIIVYAMGYLGMFDTMNHGVHEAIWLFFNKLIGLNIILFLFNMLPLPPLDGYRIVQDLLPTEQRIKLAQYEQWAIYLFLLMVFLPPLYNVVLGPLFSFQQPILNVMLGIVHAIFGNVNL